MTNQDRIYQLIDNVATKIEKCLTSINDDMSYIDPLEHREISAHYAQSHASAAFYILGSIRSNSHWVDIGKCMLSKLIKSHTLDEQLYGYHHDFNNFALSLLLDYVKDTNMHNKLKDILLSTSDSNHDTVNWLPMRMLVNQQRYALTGDKKYLDNIDDCLSKVKQATYEDGYIDDLLPKSYSFNLQYDISTIAELILFNQKSAIQYDINKGITALINAIPFDNDINFMGRGCNQIFAWGPWIYILSQLKDEHYLSEALTVLEDKLPAMLQNDNMMLNHKLGSEKYLWWDYHYASVYTSHLFLWLTLALINNKNKIQLLQQSDYTNDSGFNIHRTEDIFVSYFGGRKKYLAEKGPAVVAFGTKKCGMIIKSSFGPWQGQFGKNHSYALPVLLNYFGIIGVSKNFDVYRNRVLKRLRLVTNEYVQFKPIFAEVQVKEDSKYVIIEWKLKKEQIACFNIPVISLSNFNPKDMVVMADNKVLSFANVGSINTQFDKCELYQTIENKAKTWVLQFPK